MKGTDEIIEKPPFLLTIIVLICFFLFTLISCIFIKMNENFNYKRTLFTLIAAIIELISLFVYFVLKVNMTINLRNTLYQLFESHEQRYNLSVPQTAMIELQTHFNCCGIDSHKDWLHKYNFIPKSCRKSVSSKTIKEGCYHVIVEYSFYYWNCVEFMIIVFLTFKVIIFTMNECSNSPYVQEKEPDQS